MPKAEFFCSVCHKGYNLLEYAEICELQPNPEPKYAIGWSIEEYDGDYVAYVVKHRIINRKGSHVIQYGMQYRDGIEGETNLPADQVSEWVNEGALDKASQQGYY